jgi:hypothetical protein
VRTPEPTSPASPTAEPGSASSLSAVRPRARGPGPPVPQSQR